MWYLNVKRGLSMLKIILLLARKALILQEVPIGTNEQKLRYEISGIGQKSATRMIYIHYDEISERLPPIQSTH